MDVTLEGTYYNKVITEISIPEVADVSASDYTAKKFNKFGKEDPKGDQRAFVICHPEAVTLKVLPWLSDEPVVWKFIPGPYPMPLRKILTDAGNVLTDSGVSVATIQIGY